MWSIGEAYEHYVGRWSRLVAREFLGWLSLPQDYRWLDVGCGTGALTQTLLAMAAPRAVVGVDLSSEFVVRAREQTSSDRASFEVGNAQSLPFETGSFDVAISGLMINFASRPDVVAAEMARVVRPGGTVAAYVWDYAGEMQLMHNFWDAAVALDPVARDLDEGRRFPLCSPGPMRDLFRAAGLGDVEVRAIDVPTIFRDFDDYWLPFLGGQGPAPSYVATLSEEPRARLRARLRTQLPSEPDGSIHLIARAWAVRGFCSRSE